MKFNLLFFFDYSNDKNRLTKLIEKENEICLTRTSLIASEKVNVYKKVLTGLILTAQPVLEIVSKYQETLSLA